ncbi:stage II sporulation protein P [Fredinandcohnia quinoae]|uniref:Stage II sporulation protein P n=1 Tax=Fredinandcohnia quinoae TaxID=2918902 RepID=A0AAW5E522_9BACI|nr:stage II sporulation protein P [Fredinandcohnia sp. SECRCQ15]MCH1624997.1 stage II sporulation protein P [Fredinandcohnia sp. SECRCQ15]
MRSYKSQGLMVSIQGTSIVKGILFLIVGFIMLFSITGAIVSLKPEFRLSSSSISDITSHLSGEALIHLLGYENQYFVQSLPESSEKPNYAATIFKAATNINLDDPRSLLGRELPAFSLFDGKILVAGEGTNYTDIPIESPPPLDILLEEREIATQNLEQLEKPQDDKNPPPAMTTGDKKVVYIYHTHSWESYFPHLKGVDTSKPNNAVHNTVNVTKVGEMLSEELKARGLGTEVNKTNMLTYRNKKGYNWYQSYKASGELFASAMTNNRDLNYFIDIHRDDKRKEKSTVIINGKSYAKIAFVVGTENPHFEKNLALANELLQIIKKKYPGLSEAIYEQGGPGNNGVYNQDKSGNAMLIEFGGVDNNFEELRRSAAAIADVFAEYYWQAEKVNAGQGDSKE